jgi:peptide/nickel transport system permease protein
MLLKFIKTLASRGLYLVATCILAFTVATTTGDPTALMLDPHADAAERLELRNTLALDGPLPMRLADFVGSAIRGDFGRSWQSGRPVLSMIAEAAPATFDLGVTALLVSLALAVPLSALVASRPVSTISRAIRSISLAATALPTFVIAVILTALFSAWLGILPAFGRGTTVSVLGWQTGLLTLSGLRALILPVLTIALALTGLFVHIIDCELREILRQDYITSARARGIRPLRLHLGHALANAYPPLITCASVQFGNLTAFALATETVFQRPGLGFLCFKAIENADMPVIGGLLLLAGIVFAACGLAADLLLAVADPPARRSAHHEGPV